MLLWFNDWGWAATPLPPGYAKILHVRLLQVLPVLNLMWDIKRTHTPPIQYPPFHQFLELHRLSACSLATGV